MLRLDLLAGRRKLKRRKGLRTPRSKLPISARGYFRVSVAFLSEHFMDVEIANAGLSYAGDDNDSTPLVRRTDKILITIVTRD